MPAISWAQNNHGQEKGTAFYGLEGSESLYFTCNDNNVLICSSSLPWTEPVFQVSSDVLQLVKILGQPTHHLIYKSNKLKDFKNKVGYGENVENILL